MVVESRSQTMIDTTNTLRLHFLWLKYNLITSLSVKAFFAINLHNFTFSLATHGSEELEAGLEATILTETAAQLIFKFFYPP